jgi:hypothetical protein
MDTMTPDTPEEIVPETVYVPALAEPPPLQATMEMENKRKIKM